MEKIVMAIVGIFILVLLGANLLPLGIENALTESYEEPFIVHTGIGETDADVVLTYTHYPEDLTNLDATSNEPTDVPVVMSYTSATKTVNVSGLVASATRTLTLDYVRERDMTDMGGSGTTGFLRSIPLLVLVLGTLACLFGLFMWGRSKFAGG